MGVVSEIDTTFKPAVFKAFIEEILPKPGPRTITETSLKPACDAAAAMLSEAGFPQVHSMTGGINAWNGLALWAAASGQAALGTEATWLMSTEAASVRAYWTDPDLSAFGAFTHKVVAINWGGKRDYATWFSPEPSAMLGIQLIPMNPASGWLGQGVAPARG